MRLRSHNARCGRVSARVHDAGGLRGQPQHRRAVGPRDQDLQGRRPARDRCSTRSTAPSRCIRGTATRSRSKSRSARWSSRSSTRSRSSAAAGRQDRRQGDGAGAHRVPRRDHRRAHLTDRAPSRRGAARQQHHAHERRRIDSRRSVDGKIVLNTTDGSVTGTRLGGEIQIRSGDGSIRLDNATGKLDLETDDGSIGFEAQADGAARCGPATARFAPRSSPIPSWPTTGTSRPAMAASSLTLPGLFNAELDAETSDGVVR